MASVTELRPLEDSLFAEYTDLKTGARIKVTDCYVTIVKRIDGMRHGTTINLALLGTVAVVTAGLVEQRKKGALVRFPCAQCGSTSGCSDECPRVQKAQRIIADLVERRKAR